MGWKIITIALLVAVLLGYFASLYLGRFRLVVDWGLISIVVVAAFLFSALVLVARRKST